MKQILRVISLVMSVVLLLCTLGCAKEPVETTPGTTSPQQTTPSTEATVPTTTAPEEIPFTPVTYDSSEDAPFLPKDIYSEELVVPGIVMNEPEVILNVTGQQDQSIIVVKGEFGKCYEVKVPAGVPVVRAAEIPADPRELAVGEQGNYSTVEFLKDVEAPTEETAFMYVCRDKGQYLVIYTGSSDPVSIYQRSILEEEDTEGPWYYAEPVGHAYSETTGFANFMWTAEQVLDNLYEPYREKYPEYISRFTFGKDDTGTYDMYCYEYAPEDYEITVFLSGGMHADEQVAYLALGKVMQLIADATPADPLLYTLRQKVRFMVVPIINVYGATHGFTRANGRGEDLNRNFDDLSQKESQNMIALFKQYVDEVSFFIDFHVAAKTENISMYYNYINYADNAVANYKTNNHLYHRQLDLGYAVEDTDLQKCPGSYVKGNQYMEGHIWNNFGVSFITVEACINNLTPAAYTDECMTLAVEVDLNFIIQNALFYLQNGK